MPTLEQDKLFILALKSIVQYLCMIVIYHSISFRCQKDDTFSRVRLGDMISNLKLRRIHLGLRFDISCNHPEKARKEAMKAAHTGTWDLSLC